jgi:hypothetical protein
VFRLILILLAGMPIMGAEAAVPVLWQDPGNVRARNFYYGPGGRQNVPVPPFRFVQEELGGTTPKVRVRDARKRVWIVKFGPEVRADTFAPRLAWAAGYFVAPVYYIPRGRILGVNFGSLRRSGEHLDREGRFTAARFKLIDPKMKYMPGDGWHWKKNPFAQTRELSGLRVLLMLTSNWDAKDSRDAESNTVLYHKAGGTRSMLIHSFDDWGSTMGKWGNYFTREKWDCEGFRAQTEGFVTGVRYGNVGFSYEGKHADDIGNDIPVDHVRWLMNYLGRISDVQIRTGLKASGASPHEIQCFSRSMRLRLEQIRNVLRSRSRI